MKVKQLKDPLYGYIAIPVDIMSGVVDTAVFQRLRRITQTSYSPLFSSAVHNRFVHSLGVYYLGSIAAKTLNREIKCLLEESPEMVDLNVDHLEFIFLLACLLHDIGHAPFSHTGEMFYLENGQDYHQLHDMLKEAVGTETFCRDVPDERSAAAAPHEVMSAIVGIREFGHLMPSASDKEFFARCITGYGYVCHAGMEGIRNCFIQLLNSKVIDVDKLDYLIRDAYITGFDTVNIDYERLLTSLTVILEGSDYSLAYYKRAISVIENVVYAHDLERKWMQNHPVVLYENYILQHIMELLTEKLDAGSQKLFSAESLSIRGQSLQGGVQVRLFSDDDIISLIKRYYEEYEIISEYFERRARRHPLWKSEAEYKAFFLDHVRGGDLLDALEAAMEATAKYLSKNTTNWVINQELADTLRKDLKELPAAKVDKKSKETQEKEKREILKVVECLIRYAESVDYKGDFVLLKSSQFNSGFAKPDFSATKIVFSSVGKEKVVSFGEKVSSILGVTSERVNFFYLYSRCDKETETPKLDINQLRRELFREFV